MDRARINEGIRRMRFEALLDRYEQGELDQETAAEMLGISDRTFRRWRDRLRDEGSAGLADRRLRPSGRRAAEEEIKRIESDLTLVGGKIVHGAGDFAQLAPPPLPVLPDWSPVKEYGGYYEPQRHAGPSVSACASPNGLHAIMHRLFGQRPPTSAERFWGVGCECFAF